MKFCCRCIYYLSRRKPGKLGRCTLKNEDVSPYDVCSRFRVRKWR